MFEQVQLRYIRLTVICSGVVLYSWRIAHWKQRHTGDMYTFRSSTCQNSDIGVLSLYVTCISSFAWWITQTHWSKKAGDMMRSSTYGVFLNVLLLMTVIVVFGCCFWMILVKKVAFFLYKEMVVKMVILSTEFIVCVFQRTIMWLGQLTCTWLWSLICR